MYIVTKVNCLPSVVLKAFSKVFTTLYCDTFQARCVGKIILLYLTTTILLHCRDTTPPCDRIGLIRTKLLYDIWLHLLA